MFETIDRIEFVLADNYSKNLELVPKSQRILRNNSLEIFNKI
ncbi:hypothetical protein LEP1GSC021_2449 [Leptospira noguchii str. 1993005606]|uniref:SLEI domain protein, PF07620 family n=1 Tax=Leptospira noguchii str. 2007001578 TaxID=1049974 RepID=A0ABP2TG92_9LEPT|nr:hypothetical protein LEP1GSC035_0451 [Leptospira noguchii str. 2007001578]EPE82905.1 hypothetical protein LEP1GSC021_2449 [Leptospira noguchii str. 1993005606]